jgi:hypothetical protein
VKVVGFGFLLVIRWSLPKAFSSLSISSSSLCYNLLNLLKDIHDKWWIRVDATFHEIYPGHCEVMVDAAMRAFEGNWHNSRRSTLMGKFLEKPYGFCPSDC